MHVFISYVLRFSERILRSHEKPIGKFLYPITIVKRLSHTWEKRFVQSEISCQNESVSSQRVHAVVAPFQSYSQKFVEFPQVYTGFLAK